MAVVADFDAHALLRVGVCLQNDVSCLGFEGIFENIYQNLFNLRSVGSEPQVGRNDRNVALGVVILQQILKKLLGLIEQLGHGNFAQVGFGQARKIAVSVHKLNHATAAALQRVEGFGEVLDGLILG